MNLIHRYIAKGLALCAFSAAVTLHADAGSLLAHYVLTEDFSDLSGAGVTSVQPYSDVGDISFTAAGWTWRHVNSAQGLKLTLDTASALESYSVAFTFSFGSVQSYIKMIDFGALSGDFGVYINELTLRTYDASSDASGGSLSPNTLTHFVLTRDFTDTLSLYQNGSLVATAADNSKQFVIGPTTYFFIDDTSGAANEYTSAGSLRDLKLWDYALSSTEVYTEALAASVIPEPSTYALLLGAGSIGVACLARRHRRS